MSTDVLRFPVVIPPREHALSARLANAARRGYHAFMSARLRAAEAEVARHRALYHLADGSETGPSTSRLGTLPFVR